MANKRDLQTVRFHTQESDPNLARHRKSLENSNVVMRQVVGQNPEDPNFRPIVHGDYTLQTSGDTITISASGSGQLSLWTDDGFGNYGWRDYELSDNISFSSAGSVGGSKYGIFVQYDQINSSELNAIPITIAPLLIAWTNDTTPGLAATTLQDGASLLTSDFSYRLLSVGRYTGTTMQVVGDNSVGTKARGSGNPLDPTGADPYTGTIEDADGVRGYNSGVLQFKLSSLVGSILALAGGLIIDASGFVLKLVGGATYISFTSTRALFGSDISSANTTALAIFFVSQTYNGETMEAGSNMVGSNTAGWANVLWRPSTKELQFRGGTTVKAKISTAGNIYIANNQFITFLNSSGVADSGIERSSTNDFSIANNFIGKGINIQMATTTGAPSLIWSEDPSLIDQSLLTIPSGPLGRGILSLGAGVSINESQATDIASAATTDIGAANGNYANITGTTTITALGNIQAGVRRIVTFSGALTLTYNATSLILPGAANIVTVAGDVAMFVSLGSGNWKCIDYSRASGVPSTGTNTGNQTIRSPLFGSGENNTIALSSTMFLAPGYSNAPQTSEADVIATSPVTGTLLNFYIRTRLAQPATGALVATVRVGSVDTAIAITVAAGAATGLFSDVAHTAPVTGGQGISYKFANAALAVSATLAMNAIELDAS